MPSGTDARAIERLRREARAAAKLRGEHVVRVMDIGTLFVIRRLSASRLDRPSCFHASDTLPSARAKAASISARSGSSRRLLLARGQVPSLTSSRRREGWLSSSFTLTLRNGQKVSFVVFDRDKWIVHVNARLGPP